jgi:hypothetical protein
MTLLHQVHLPKQGNKQEMVVRVKTGAPEGGNLEDEPVDHKPSPLREKNENKSHQQDDDVYSLSRLSPPRPSLHKV